jgi:hypothetical protein
MDDLFGEPELPAGFRYIPDAISTADEKSLVQRFEKLPLKPFEFHGHQGNRRIYTFGHRYVFAGQEPRADASIPDYLLPLTDVASQISGVPAEAIGVFAPWPGAEQLATQHRADGRSALLRDLAYVSPWPKLLERLAFHHCGCQIGE